MLSIRDIPAAIFCPKRKYQRDKTLDGNSIIFTALSSSIPQGATLEVKATESAAMTPYSKQAEIPSILLTSPLKALIFAVFPYVRTNRSKEDTKSHTSDYDR
jgi:hypothetical protein